MENIIISLNAALPLFIVMLVGYLLKKYKFYTEESVKIFNKLVFKIIFPIHLFNSISKNKLGDGLEKRYVIYIVLSIIAIFLISALSVSYFEKEKNRKGVIIQALFRSNFLIMGFPVVESLYGEGGKLTVALLTAIVIPLFTILAVISFNIFTQEKLDIKKIIIEILKNPLTIGCMTGIIFYLSNIHLTGFLEKSADDIGRIASPLAVLLLGASLKSQSMKENLVKIIPISILKLIIIPVVFMFIGIAMGFRDIKLVIAYIVFGGPIAVSSFTMAEVMGGDGELAGQLVILTTLCSVVTIFFGIFFMKSFNFI